MKTYNFLEAHKTIKDGLLTVVASDDRFQYKAYQQPNGLFMFRKFVIAGGYWSTPLRGKSRQPEIIHFIECATKFIEELE